jgi:folate-binding protein YgfZ
MGPSALARSRAGRNSGGSVSASATEYHFLAESAGVLDLSSRGRLCVTGTDRVRFLNGQVTNNVKDLAVGQGCYAALVNAKGKLQSDLNIYCLPDELLMDFEPGLSATVVERLEKYIIADDVQIVDVAPNYGMLTIQGPGSAAAIAAAGFQPPAAPMHWTSVKTDSAEIYCMNNPRGAAAGFDFFMPTVERAELLDRLVSAAKAAGGGLTSFEALEVVRVEAGLPRFGVDMDASNLASEAVEARAINYAKGCYIGQEVISRIRAYGEVAKSLRGLRLADDLAVLPARGDKLLRDGKEIGYITSAVRSPKFHGNIALGYVRREHKAAGTNLEVIAGQSRVPALVCDLPFN